MFASKEEIRLRMIELITKAMPSDLISANRIIDDAEKLSDYVIKGSMKNKCRDRSQSLDTESKAQDSNREGLIFVFGCCCHPQHKQF